MLLYFVYVHIVLSGVGLQDLKELHLDRTLITDHGAAIIKGMTVYETRI